MNVESLDQSEAVDYVPMAVNAVQVLSADIVDGGGPDNGSSQTIFSDQSEDWSLCVHQHLTVGTVGGR